MTIIFPMAGLSSRFTKAGYKKPKYMLNIDENTVFFHAVNSFKKYFPKCEILFIYRNILDTQKFIKNECMKMNIESYSLVELEEETEGQAHTVALGIEKSNIKAGEDILIFNIDTFRPNFELPKDLDFKTLDGYLEVFEGEGEHWSFVLPENDKINKVIKTTEKIRISNLCSSGLYYFKDVSDFIDTFNVFVKKGERSKGEYYIAPMYNYLIEKGLDIRYSKIALNQIIFCGTPKEYETILKEQDEK